MKTSRLEIRIEPELKKAAQDKAEKDGVKLSQLIVKLLKEYLNELEYDNCCHDPSNRLVKDSENGITVYCKKCFRTLL